MNRFSEQLLEAFEVAMDEKLSKLQYDKTIQAVITSIEDVNKGEYKVKYQEGIITAYAKDPTESFRVGDIVYIIVPQSDFTGKKFISHKVTNKTLSTGQYSDLSETIIEVSPDLSKLGFIYTSTGPWELVAGAGRNASGQEIDVDGSSVDHIIISESQQLSSQFNAYLNKYEYLQIKAEFMTSFDKDHTTGDYGIELGFRTTPTEDNPDGQLIPYFLNLSDFVGDPYHLWTWTPQSVVVRLPKENLYSLAGISFYEKDFDDSIGEQQINPNIFMKDLQISFIEKVDLTDIPYYLTIFPVNGVLFTNSLSSLVLNARVVNYGQEIDSKDCVYKWFKRDLTVSVGDEDYNKQAGWGWKPVIESDKEQGSETSSLTVSSSVVTWQQSYKLVVIYNSSVVMTQEITLYKERDNISIEQITQNNTIKLKLSGSYKGLWYYLDTNGRQQSINTSKSNEVDITSYLFYSPMTFYCQIYSDTTYLGELTYTMRSMESSEDVSVVFVGESIFNYDANGDIGLEYSQIEQTLTPEIIFNNGVISSSIKIEWLDFNGNVISETGDGYDPSGSMIESVRVDKNTNSLQYKIKKDFEEVPSKKNNTFKLRVTTLDGQNYTFEKEIIFIKVGDPGTNGTSYQSIIRVISDNPFVATTQNANLKVRLQCTIYRGSQQLDSNDCTITWSAFHLTLIEDPNVFGVVTVQANDDIKDKYVKATIKINNASENTTLYNFYGVDSVNNIDNFNSTIDKEEFLLGLSKLPDKIQYQASGLNPLCKKQVPIVNKTTITSTKASLLAIQNGLFVPAKEFDPTNNIALLLLEHTSTSFIVYHPVPMYINTFGNEAINGWDGVQLDLGDTANSHVFAPQVGAGAKDSSNRFTGVVMGKDSSQNKIGLYGYKDGISTFGLREDGTAYFGASGRGRIDIDGTQAIISGGGGGASANGMTITLAKQSDSKNDAIRIGNGNFVVAYDGTLTAKNANIEGVLTAGTGSKIGGWTIQATKLENGSSSSYVALNTDVNINEAIWAGNATSTKAPFRVTRTGVLTATNATITGTINANTGYIGGTSGWTIDTNKIYSAKNSKYVALSNQGNYAFYAGSSDTNDSGSNGNPAKAPFSVTFDGALKATNAIISGTITAGSGSKIGGWNLTDTRLYSGSGTSQVALDSGTSGVNEAIWAGHTTSTSAPFRVTRAGVLTATNATITGTINANKGYIGGTSGGWKIETNKISSAIDTSYYIEVDREYSTSTDLSTGKVTTTETIPIFNYKTYSNKNYVSFTLQDSDTIFYTLKTNVKTVTTKPYIGLSSQGNIAIWAGSTTSNNAPFRITQTGYLVATQATIQGKITADSGQIGGWAISNKQLSSGTVHLYSGTESAYETGDTPTDYYRIWAGSNSPSSSTRFYITNRGKLKATNAEITGIISATSGTIGGWTIKTNRLENSDGTIYLGPGGTKLTNADINGKITANSGSIGGWTIAPSTDSYSGALTNTDRTVYLSPTYVKLPGLTLSATGTASFNGNITTANITATGGSIGGWTINSGSLFSGNVSLNSSGTISGATISGGSISIGNGNFQVSSTGVMTANGTLSLTGATGNKDIISISGTGAGQNCTGSLGLATGSDGSGLPTYNTRLYSSQNLILDAGAVRVDTTGGFYVDVGNTTNIISVPSSGTAINLKVTAAGLTILENGVNTSLAEYVSSHGGGGGGTAKFG